MYNSFLLQPEHSSEHREMICHFSYFAVVYNYGCSILDRFASVPFFQAFASLHLKSVSIFSVLQLSFLIITPSCPWSLWSFSETLPFSSCSALDILIYFYRIILNLVKLVTRFYKIINTNKYHQWNICQITYATRSKMYAFISTRVKLVINLFIEDYYPTIWSRSIATKVKIILFRKENLRGKHAIKKLRSIL